MSLRFLFSLLLAAIQLAACGNDHDIRTRIDGDWHRHSLEKDHLGHWLKALPTANGFFNTAVTRDWQVIDSQPGDIVSHTRAIYLMAVGHEMTGNPAYLEQVRLGTNFLLEHFHDPLHGGWVEAVGPDGKLKNGNKRLYSQAFVIFALAHAYRATHDPRYLEAARLTWQDTRLRFADGKGGYRAGMNRDFSNRMINNTQNPIMHLFEALLALHQASGDPAVLQDAESVAKFVAYHLLEGLPDGTARIAELYDDDWSPLSGERGGYIDIGHQFEWAFLFSAGSEAGVSAIYAEVANRLLDYAIANGYDAGESGVRASMTPDGKINHQRSFWQQAEALRTLMHHAAVRNRSDLWGRVTQMTEYIRSEFLDEKHGGWYIGGVTECRKNRCPDRQPDGYHMTALHQEAIRIAARGRK